jgi:hypothetical protein
MTSAAGTTGTARNKMFFIQKEKCQERWWQAGATLCAYDSAYTSNSKHQQTQQQSNHNSQRVGWFMPPLSPAPVLP